MTEQQFRDLARTARIELTDAESGALREQLEERLAALAPLLAVEAAGAPGWAVEKPVATSGLRPDTPRPSLSQPDALRGAAAAQDGYFRVPRTQSDS